MSRWNIIRNGKALAWDTVPGEYHTEDLEMAGFYSAYVVRYGYTADGFLLQHHMVFPTYRIFPNNTHGSYQLDIPGGCVPKYTLNGAMRPEFLRRVEIDGTLTFYSEVLEDDCCAKIRRICYPSVDYAAGYQLITVENTGKSALELDFAPFQHEMECVLGPMGRILCESYLDGGAATLQPGESTQFSIIFTARYGNEDVDFGDPLEQYRRRLERVEELTAPMALDTGNTLLDTFFRFAKIRAGESVFDTMYGPIHSPGGYAYYAATWCNDQVEYSGPYFAYTGDETLLEASMNAYRMYMPYMTHHYDPIPSSVIAEGIDFWNGAGDRGDAAMYLYGASRFALTCGREEFAEELIPAIQWCAEYCRRKINENGVVASDSDELENRFSSGDANLCTSVLACGGYSAAADLMAEYGEDALAEEYRTLSENLKIAIEKHFGDTLHGFKTYRYHEGCDTLRAWICIPMCAGIFDRAEETVKALTSEYLLTHEGFLSCEGCPTIWDRATLYGLRGIFSSGITETATEVLLHYAEQRLLGERVPYPVEAYPEGGQRHLSGESALLCKVVLEGILDITPTGLDRFTIKPSMPTGLDHLYLRNIHAYGTTFDVLLEQDGWKVVRFDGAELACGGYDGVAVEVASI